jgi:hypothetical protein
MQKDLKYVTIKENGELKFLDGLSRVIYIKEKHYGLNKKTVLIAAFFDYPR